MEARHKIEDIHLSDYWNIVKKRRILVVGCTVVAVAFALVSSFLMKPVYKTTARLAVERETISSPIAATRTEYADVQSQMLTFNTHYRLLTSKPVLLMLLEELEKENISADRKATVEESPKAARDTVRQVISQTNNWLKASIRGLFGKDNEEASPEIIMVQKLNALQSKITVTHLRDTRLLTIDVEDTNPQIAARIANLLTEKYIEFDMGIRLDADNRHIAWLTRELYNMGQKLEDDEKKFFEYKQQQGVFSLEGQQRVLDQRSSELNNEYLVTQNQRQEIDTKLAEIEKKYKGVSDIAHIRSILDNQSINSIYNTMTALELEHARQSKVLKPKHPKMLQMASEIEKVKDKLKSELEKEVENMRVQRTVLLNREKLMKENIAQFEQDVLDASTKELTYTILQRNMDTSQKLYDTLVSKIKETGIVAGAVASNVRIVETSIVPLSPYKPDKKRNLLIGLLLGVAGGVGLAFFREYLDLTIRDEEDIARLVELPVLAVIPIAHKAEKRGY